MTSAQRVACLSAGTALAAVIGVFFGQPLAYGVANLVDRDPAEIKGTFIWCAVLTPLVFAAAGFALAAVATRSGAKPVALKTFVSITVLSAVIVFASYDPPKTAGIPIIDYELAFPAAIHAQGIGGIDLTLWNGRNGQGCAITRLSDQGARRLIIGSFALSADNTAPTLSIAFHDGERWTNGGTWVLRHENRSMIEAQFGSWQEIAFSGHVRELPLAPGVFEIRYRLRRFI